MSSGRADSARHLQTLFSLGTAGALTDGELLERFVVRHDGVAEAAFALLVERHGPVVLKVCRDVLGNPDDAADAFQATFLVLVRRAGSIRNRESVASWLYGVARRVAGAARSANMRRRLHERKAAVRTMDGGDGAGDDVGPVLHEEVGRLPEKYRAAVVLCYWEGLTHEQAADRLRWPVGTVRSRLSWARQRLRTRLIRRGLAPAGAVALLELTGAAQGAVPAVLIEGTVQGALQLAAGRAMTAGSVSAAAWGLSQGVIKTMMLARWKWAAAVLLTVGITAAGAGGLAVQEKDAPQPPEAAQGESLKTGSPRLEEAVDEHIRRLQVYDRELSAKITALEKQWLELAEEANVERTDLNRVSVAESRQVREQLFTTNMDLLVAEALLKNRQAEVDARPAGKDTELLLQKEVDEGLRNDEQLTALRSVIEEARKKLDQAARNSRSPNDPARVMAQRNMVSLQEKLRDLVEWKRVELTNRFRDQGGVKGLALVEAKAQIEDLKTRKSAFEQLLHKLRVTSQPPENEVKVALVREDLASLRETKERVQKWIEHLQWARRR